MLRKLVLLFILLFNLTVNSQEQEVNSQEQEVNPRSVRKFGIGGQLFGPTLALSANLNYFITHNLNVEIGGGIIGYYGGFNYYFGKSDKQHEWTPYFGVHYASIYIPWEMYSFIYAPVGIQMMKIGGLTFAFELAFFYNNNHQKSYVWGALKFGYNF